MKTDRQTVQIDKKLIQRLQATSLGAVVPVSKIVNAILTCYVDGVDFKNYENGWLTFWKELKSKDKAEDEREARFRAVNKKMKKAGL